MGYSDSILLSKGKMIRKNSHLGNTCLDSIEALRCIGLRSCKRNDASFPAVHWTVDVEDLNLARTRRAADILRSRGYRAASARQVSDTISLIFVRCGVEGLESISIPVPLCRATDALLRCPRGLLMGFFGPDGVGKSSVSSAAIRALGPLFDHSRTVCWRPQLISSRIAKEPHRFKLPHDGPPHGPLLSMLKLTGACLDFALDHATLTRNQLRGCTLVAWDRYLHDVAIDKKRYRYRGPLWYSDLILRLLPIPEHFLGIVLDADESVITKRKHDLPPDEIQRQRMAYQRLATALPRTHVVKNDGNFDSCLRRVLSIAISAMADWFEPVAGEMLNVSCGF